jgi:hypothetical protein
MKKYILLVIFFFVCFIKSYSQEIIEYNGDTLIAISQRDLRTINTIIVEHEYNLKELDLRKQQNLVDSVSLALKDSIIVEKNLILAKKEEYYVDLNSSLLKDLEREKKKYRRLVTGTTVGAGAVAVLVGILVLCK